MTDFELLQEINNGRFTVVPLELTSAHVQTLASDLRERGFLRFEEVIFMGEIAHFFIVTSQGIRWLLGVLLSAVIYLN